MWEGPQIDIKGHIYPKLRQLFRLHKGVDRKLHNALWAKPNWNNQGFFQGNLIYDNWNQVSINILRHGGPYDPILVAGCFTECERCD